MIRHIFLVLFCFLIQNQIQAEMTKLKSGIIFNGLDTLPSSIYSYGMDFYIQRPCTGITDISCKGHITLKWYPDERYYYLAIKGNEGLYAEVGDLNFDTVRTAPSDSGMNSGGTLGNNPVFSIAPDSLTKCIGNVYIIKTGRDPRWDVPFYAKIKILSFTVRDSANHEVDMGFLWACNISGSRDLVTTGLDTFNLETPTILSYDKGSTRLRPAVFARPGKYSTFLMLHGRQGLRGVRVPGVSVGGVGLDGRSGRELAN